MQLFFWEQHGPLSLQHSILHFTSSLLQLQSTDGLMAVQAESVIKATIMRVGAAVRKVMFNMMISFCLKIVKVSEKRFWRTQGKIIHAGYK
jgi:uncharacterized membrane protein